MNFEILKENIQNTHIATQQSAVKAVNTYLTVRNWLVGYYIVTFEQHGEDRAKYGTFLLQKLADRLDQKSLSHRNLKLCRQFYGEYPQIGQSITAFLENNTIRLQSLSIGQLPIAQLVVDSKLIAVSEVEDDEKIVFYKKLIHNISFTHFVELLKIKDPSQRNYYELLILKTQPSVSQLKKQINTLSFERVGLSQNMESAFELLAKKIEPEKPTDAIKSHYVFDFLKLENLPFIEESTLEQALINHLQEFIIELGNGFCFEARQKRILIDEEYYFADLVFYHRILKCHIIVELKVDQFKHEYLSQLNTYVSYYKEEIKQPDDNPPIGILLCTQKGDKLVEYALSGMDEKLFVSKYLLQLPSKELLQAFITSEMKKQTKNDK
jgi:predicted nuclease of restriction endonuclease-like (RecB) superfamily